MARWLYVLVSLSTLGGWVAIDKTGWSPTASTYTIPPSVRHSPGGYRSFHFWHSGFQAGK